MYAYIKGVIVIGAVSSLILTAIPPGREKRYVKYISQLAVLLVLLAPLSGIIDFVSSLRTEIPVQAEKESLAEDNVIAGSAENISRYIAENCAEKFSLDPVNIKVHLILDESDTENVKIEEIQIFTDEKRKEEKERIKKYFEELLCTEVYVFGP